MEAIEAIMGRHMEPKVTSELLKREDVESLIKAAVRAPNHHLTQPWRFLVLATDELEKLGEVMAERVRKEYEGDATLEKRVEAEKAKPLRAPVILVVIYVPATNPKAIEIEDRYTIGAAMQNILLAAHAEGFGAYLRTGPAAEDPAVGDFLGLDEGEEVAGFIYLGKPDPDSDRGPTRRDDALERAKWRGFPE